MLPFFSQIKRRRKYRRSIGLQDRNYCTIHENDTLQVKVDGGNTDEEIIGVVRWSKYVAGYTLQDQEFDMNIGTFRFRVWGPVKIREMGDGRIDGVILNKE